jgi:uncharacterized protein (TIGR03118 family)
MNYSHLRRLLTKAFIRPALPCLLLLVLLVVLVLPSSPPSSAAARETRASFANNQQGPRVAIPTGTYRQTNLVSDQPGVALIEDRLLKAPWGVALNSGSPFWVANSRTDSATIYEGDVSGSPLVPNLLLPSVAIPNIPTLVPAPSQPIAVVANTTNDFLVSRTAVQPAPAQFIFATLSGGISAWQAGFGSTAEVIKFISGHSYTGIAIGNNASGNVLYAVDFENGHIDIFDKDFNLTSVSGNFADATIPANFHAYNIRNLGGALYVSYSQFQNGLNFDTGFVRKFDANGVRDLAFAINNGPLLNPWGMVIAPASFGAFSNQLLVGNSRLSGIHDPSINAFNPATGAPLGYMVDEGGTAIEIKGLRALVFGNGSAGGDASTLYFSSGTAIEVVSEGHGIFGSLKPAPAVPASTIKFSNTEYHTTENAGHIDITVTRSGDLSGTATVNYATVDNIASQKSQYEIALGRLTFNPGDSSKSFRVFLFLVILA